MEIRRAGCAIHFSRFIVFAPPECDNFVRKITRAFVGVEDLLQ